MEPTLRLDDILIRTSLLPGDLQHIVFLHGELYKKEFDYEVQFENYVAEGLAEFSKMYDPARNRVWMCEHNGICVGSLVLVDRGSAAQLRYFLILPEYRGIGLGNKLMQHYLDFMKECGYTSSFLWTTQELDTAAHLYTKYGFVLTESKPSTAFGKEVVENKYELIL